ncbi:AlpA family transcriptional regulator [Tabrizicola sp.]|uniref:helix-turn-helix transcriptional regulator n=1 Tax=Tabrizicola sp. TaxID=2005166 RepID=UPI0027372A98|nr:helix-turn-helix domain-containing protein [Tabrizicola sp.]MDP3196931.1 AlpA family phage regulatory protein [Tabrizicola sp.]
MNTIANQDSLYLSVDQVAQRYGVSTDSIWRWKRQGDFPKAFAIGPNCTRWRLSDLIAHEGQLKACLAEGMFAA